MLNFKKYKECEDELLIKVLSRINKKKYKYAVRDTDGVIRLFEEKPYRNKTGNYCGKYTYIDIGSGDRIYFSNINHKDGLYDIENKCFIKV